MLQMHLVGDVQTRHDFVMHVYQRVGCLCRVGKVPTNTALEYAVSEIIPPFIRHTWPNQRLSCPSGAALQIQAKCSGF